MSPCEGWHSCLVMFMGKRACRYVRVYHSTCWLAQGGSGYFCGCRYSVQASSAGCAGCGEAGEGAASPEYQPTAERGPAARRPRSVHARSLPQRLSFFLALRECHSVLLLCSALCLIVGWQPGRRMLVFPGLLRSIRASAPCQ